MRDVVVIGGGLTGLSAAYELSQHELDVTLIDVKRQLGGSIQTIQQENSILDAAAFAIRDSLDSNWLESLELSDAMFPLKDNVMAFKAGTGSLIAALQSKISATRLMRMAVSSIGELKGGGYSICMENGLMFDAKALILAVPARYAERMFYGYINDITAQLLDYHYDTLLRVSLVCKTKDLPVRISTPPDMAYSFIHRTEHPARVPDGYTLLQFGMRIDPKRLSSDDGMVKFLCEGFRLPKPLTSHVAHWSEADPVSCYDDEHKARIGAIRDKLPEGIKLVGSDYCLDMPAKQGVAHLDERIQQGIEAARQVIGS